MKKILFILSFILITFSLSAQKAVRSAVRDGNKAYKDQLYGNAEEKYKKAQGENQASKEASFNLANTYYKQQKWDEALKEYRHYLTLENQDRTKVGAAWANVGNTYLKKKANEKGQQQAQPPQQGQQGGGQQQEKPDDLKLSMEAYKMSLRNNPNDDQVRYNLAVVQKMIQDQQGEGGGQDNKNQDKKDQDKKDQDKKDQDKKDQDKKDQNQDQKKDDKQQQKQDQSGMSEQNMQQILNAIEQDERETQQRVKEAQAQERQMKNRRNKQQNKDW